MKKILLLPIFVVVFSLGNVASVRAAALTVGNDPSVRTVVDTYANFTIIDTNHPVSADGTLTQFNYYAFNTNHFRFVLVDSSNVVKWVSDEITPGTIGTQMYTPVSPVTVNMGWNLGVYSVSTGVIPFEYTGNLAPYTPNNNGLPVVGSILANEGSSGRTYSLGATGVVTVGPPTDKDQCKKNGWIVFNNPAFKNQGQCVSFVEKAKEKKDQEDRQDGMKTNGDIWLHQGSSDTHIIFEAKKNDKGKVEGTLDWTRTGDYQNHIVGHIIEVTGTGNDMQFVISIDVSTDFPSWVGEHLKFYVHDGGTPGTAGDTIQWQWVGPTLFSGSYGEPVVSGNLVVHN